MLKLLADAMTWLLKAPFTVINWVNQVFLQRTATSKAMSGVEGELKPLSKAKQFFIFVGKVLLVLLLVALFVGVLFFLWWLNDVLSLERFLGGPLPILRPYWLIVLFLLFLASCFVGFRLYRSLGPDRDVIEFADIEEAWVEAQAALIEAGIDITSAPLFLVLGRTMSNPHAFLSSSRLTFAVQQVPLRAKAALQVYANAQGIYVLALDACLLGRQAELLAEALAAPPVDEPNLPLHTVFDEPPEVKDDVPAPAPAPPATPNLLADLSAADAMPGAATATMPWVTDRGKARMPSLLKRTEDVDTYQRRLGFLTRRLVKARAPYCPLNGVLVVLQFDALDNDEDASQMATLCQYDLQVVHDVARTRCPLVVLTSDLETAPGFAALGASLDFERRQRLFGQDLPLQPDLKPEELPLMLTSSLRHFNQALAQWILRLFRVEQAEGELATTWTAANSQLYEILDAIRQREKGLERILTRVMAGDAKLEFMLAGYYLAATGTNAETDQAFVPGVFGQLVQSQNCVAWTDEGLAEEADYRRWTTYGYAALGIFCIAVGVLLYSRWQMLQW
ncbi:MAG: hypothetical protein HY289_13625 [Planctomycetes bacterium]|nr:hypothetical protein [Planctomycetota bacterium]